MTDIFESLENLPVSEACFEDIIGLVETFLSEGKNIQNSWNNASPEVKDKVTDKLVERPEFDHFDNSWATRKVEELVKSPKIPDSKKYKVKVGGRGITYSDGTTEGGLTPKQKATRITDYRLKRKQGGKQ